MSQVQSYSPADVFGSTPPAAQTSTPTTPANLQPQSYSPAEVFGNAGQQQTTVAPPSGSPAPRSFAPSEIFGHGDQAGQNQLQPIPQPTRPTALSLLQGTQPAPSGHAPSNVPINPNMTEAAMQQSPIAQLLQAARQERGQMNQAAAQQQALAAAQQKAQAGRLQMVQNHPVLGRVANFGNAVTQGIQQGMGAGQSMFSPKAGQAAQAGLPISNPVAPGPEATAGKIIGGAELPVAASVVNPALGVATLGTQAGGQARSDIEALRQQGKTITPGQEFRQVASQAAVMGGAGALFGGVGKWVGDAISGMAPEAAAAVQAGDATAIQKFTTSVLTAAGKSISGASINTAAQLASNAIKRGVDPSAAITQGWDSAAFLGAILPHVMAGPGTAKGEAAPTRAAGEPAAARTELPTPTPKAPEMTAGAGNFEPQKAPLAMTGQAGAGEAKVTPPTAPQTEQTGHPAPIVGEARYTPVATEDRGQGPTESAAPIQPGQQMTFMDALTNRAAKPQSPRAPVSGEPLPGELEHADQTAKSEQQAAGEGNMSRHKGIVDTKALEQGLNAAINVGKTTVGGVAEDVNSAISKGTKAAAVVTDALSKIFPVEASAFEKTFYGGKSEVPQDFDQAKAVLRGAANEATNLHQGAVQTLDAAKRSFDGMSPADQIEFQKNAYNGTPQKNPALQDIADQLYSIGNQRRQQLADLGVEAAKGWEDQHWNMLWKKSPGTESRPARIGGAGPIGGRTGADLLQGRTLDNFDQGIEAGLEPKNLNPIQQFAETDAAQRRWISMGRAVKNLSMIDSLYRATPGDETANTRAPDPGHEDVTDLIPRALQSLVGHPENGDRIYASPELAQLLKNITAKSWFQGGPIRQWTLNALRGTNNLLTQLALGVSGFHLKKTFLLEQGAMQMAEGRMPGVPRSYSTGGPTEEGEPGGPVIQGAGVPGEGLPGLSGRAKSIQNSMMGLSDMLDPGSRKIINAMRTQMTAEHDPFYSNKLSLNLKDAWDALKSGDLYHTGTNLAKTAVKALPWASQELTQRLIFSSVQRAKLTFAFDSMQQFLKANPNAGDAEIAAEAGRIGDHVDNILGLLNRDNLMWNKTARDVAGLSMMSVGWNYGSARSLLSAGREAVAAGRGALTGEPEGAGTRNLRYWAATALATVTYGYLHNKMTGNSVNSLTDLLYPPNGQKKPDGTPKRENPGFYATDVYDMLTSPIKTIEGKAAPILHIMSELATNSDYKGNMIFNRTGSAAQEAEDIGKYLLTQHLTPISVHNIMESWSQAKTPEAKANAILMGLVQRNASTYATSSAAENLAHTLSEQHRSTLTPDEATRSDTHEGWIQSLEQTKNDPDTIKEMKAAIKAGTLSKAEGEELLRDAAQDKKYPGLAGVPLRSSLGGSDLTKIFNAASDDERRQMLPMLKYRISKVNPKAAADLADWITLKHKIDAWKNSQPAGPH